MPSFFNDLSLKTKLLVMMLFLSFLSIGLLFLLYARAERNLIGEVKRYTDELSAAIQISMEQLTQDEVKDERLKEYVGRMKKKGIQSLSILDTDKEVIASSNPAVIGKTMAIKGDPLRMQGDVQEYVSTSEGLRNYDVLLPVVVGNEKMGYVHIAIKLDDFAELQRVNNLRRLLATSLVFVLGIAVSIFLSMKYTEPIHQLARAAQRVAAGDLSEIREVQGKNEIGELTHSFNEMVKGLREMKELEERLRQSEHLSQIGQLASGIAHEVRNPLNMVNLSIDHIRSKYQPDDIHAREEFLGILSGIKGEIYRLNGMISNFLDYGKPVKLNIAPESLAESLDEVLNLAAEKVREQNVVVQKNYQVPLPAVPMDKRQMKTCFMNLVLNALQAMPEGGKLTVEILSNQETVVVKIKDSGVGIDPENAVKIFEPYFTTKEAGIGLGLALTKRIIEEHGGLIQIDSGENIGTEVLVELPLVAEA